MRTQLSSLPSPQAPLRAPAPAHLPSRELERHLQPEPSGPRSRKHLPLPSPSTFGLRLENLTDVTVPTARRCPFGEILLQPLVLPPAPSACRRDPSVWHSASYWPVPSPPSPAVAGSGGGCRGRRPVLQPTKSASAPSPSKYRRKESAASSPISFLLLESLYFRSSFYCPFSDVPRGSREKFTGDLLLAPSGSLLTPEKL